jgi:hypothetical protein
MDNGTHCVVVNSVAYLVCAKDDVFHDVIKHLGGYVWGDSPMHMTGSHLVILPGSVELHCGETKAGGGSTAYLPMFIGFEETVPSALPTYSRSIPSVGGLPSRQRFTP